MKIVINEGGNWNSVTMAQNFSQNYMNVPIVREVLEVAEKRQLLTMIVSGVETDDEMFGMANDKMSLKKSTKIGIIPDGKLIGGSRYDYQVMGRIQADSIIVAQVGSSNSDGTFTAQMYDNTLYTGVVVKFYTGRLARVQQFRGGSVGNYIYEFQTMDKQIFTWATEVTPQAGQKTCMAAYTAYGEASKTSGSNNFAPSTYAGHLTIQRKTGWISGDAMSQIVTYNLDKTGKGPGKLIGWEFKQIKQAKAAWLLEDDFAKMHGESTMRDSAGVLQPRSLVQDKDGNDVIAGDGVIPQIAGANDMSPSGSDGMPTIEDFMDMMSVLKRNADMLDGNVWYVVTGSDGYSHAGKVLRDYWHITLGGRSNVTSGQANISVGSTFNTFEFDGNKLVFVCNVRWDDKKMWTQKTVTGKSVMGSSYIFLNNGFNDQGSTNMEILAKGANGVSRALVTNIIGGLTGKEGVVSMSGVDAQEFNMLKQNGIFVYNTQACGRIMAIAA